MYPTKAINENKTKYKNPTLSQTLISFPTELIFLSKKLCNCYPLLSHSPQIQPLLDSNHPKIYVNPKKQLKLRKKGEDK